MDTGFAIGSILRLQVPRARMANGWALGEFGGEFGQGVKTYAGAARARYIRKSLKLGSFNVAASLLGIQGFTCVRL